MLILDTNTLAATDRAEAYQAAVSQNCSTSMATFEDPKSFSAELHVFEFGPAKVFNIDASANTLRRTPRMARAVESCEVTLALPMRTRNHLSWRRDNTLFGPRDLMLVDLSAPYVYGWEGDGASYAFHLDFDQLGLPMDTIYSASQQLQTSPLYSLVRDHIARVVSDAKLIEGSDAAAEIGAASAQLMHALIVSAANDPRHLDEAMHSSLAARVQAYVQLNIRDPELSPGKIAAANGISVRALYNLYEALERSLEQSIIEQRLQGARADLSAAHQRYASIESTARAWGFSTASFFSSKFRQRFGLTPRQWRNGMRTGSST